MLEHKNILIGITGGIAAYKIPILIRELTKSGASVRVIMTQSAKAFITPITVQALCGNPVHEDLLDAKAEAAMGHIELARFADLFLIAPATADTLAKLAAGEADNLLLTTALATPAPVAVAPAMNQAMYRHPQTTANLATLAENGVAIWGPASGEQACGDVGPGRMLEPEELFTHIQSTLLTGKLAGKRVTISAGPTREHLDPARFLSNPSSGKMGFALAREAVNAGARVTLIAGPVTLATPRGVERIDVISAADMAQAVHQHMPQTDIFISAAAVADYTPIKKNAHKSPKQTANLVIEFQRTEDILATVSHEYPDVMCVGFSAQTQDHDKHATRKLREKRLAMLIANDISEPSVGFASDENAITIYHKDSKQALPRMSKAKCAAAIIDSIATESENHE